MPEAQGFRLGALERLLRFLGQLIDIHLEPSFIFIPNLARSTSAQALG
jgi:hypothetical protein